MYQNVTIGQLRAINVESIPADKKDVADAIRSTVALHDSYDPNFKTLVHQSIADLCQNSIGTTTPGGNGAAVLTSRTLDVCETTE
jgi:hypothetical protein